MSTYVYLESRLVCNEQGNTWTPVIWFTSIAAHLPQPLYTKLARKLHRQSQASSLLGIWHFASTPIKIHSAKWSSWVAVSLHHFIMKTRLHARSPAWSGTFIARKQVQKSLEQLGGIACAVSTQLCSHWHIFRFFGILSCWFLDALSESFATRKRNLKVPEAGFAGQARIPGTSPQNLWPTTSAVLLIYLITLVFTPYEGTEWLDKINLHGQSDHIPSQECPREKSWKPGSDWVVGPCTQWRFATQTLHEALSRANANRRTNWDAGRSHGS